MTDESPCGRCHKTTGYDCSCEDWQRADYYEAEVARLTAERDALRAAMVQHLTILDAELKEHGYAEVGTLRATVRNALAFATADNLTSRQKTGRLRKDIGHE